MKAIWLAVGVVFGGAVLALATVKVANELKMTKAYDAQAKEQKRVADILQAEKDLGEKEFEATGTCKVSRFVYKGGPRFYLSSRDGSQRVEKSNDPLEGKVVTNITCGGLR